MNGFKKKQHKIIFMVVFALLLQLVGPVVSDYGYAGGENEKSFTIDNIEVKDGSATIDWIFKLKSNEEAETYEFEGDFNLEEEKSGKVIADDEDKAEIGEYTISTQGGISVEIYEDLYKTLEEGGAEHKDKNKDGNDEVINDESHLDKDENNKVSIEKTLALLSSSEGGLYIDKGEDEDEAKDTETETEETEKEEVKISVFKGSFEVEGAEKKPSILNSVKNTMMGLFGGGEGTDLGNIFTDIDLKVDELSISPDSEDPIEIDQNTQMELTYKWEIVKGVEVNDGDWAEMEVPKAFKFDGISEGDIFIEVLDEEDEPTGESLKVASYKLEDNKLKLVFNEELKNLEKRKGQGGFHLKFNLEEFKDDTIQRIEFGEPSKSFNIKLPPQGGELKLISKTGGPNFDINPTHIEWVIDVNTSLEKMTDAKVGDLIPEGLELDGNIKKNYGN